MSKTIKGVAHKNGDIDGTRKRALRFGAKYFVAWRWNGFIGLETFINVQKEEKKKTVTELKSRIP